MQCNNKARTGVISYVMHSRKEMNSEDHMKNINLKTNDATNIVYRYYFYA
jgi:hypothetical protein